MESLTRAARRAAGAGRARAIASALSLSIATLAATSCLQGSVPGHLSREELFALSYGPAEDQIDLFQVQGADGSRKTRIYMRDGVFYLSNGNADKVVRFSSFGDVLAVIYNPEKGPKPTIQKGQSGEKTARPVTEWPFNSPGEIAVDSAGTVYVEDRMPAERRVVDTETGALYDYALLRFDRDGNYLDYLGQEGIGGTPFPYILGVYTVAGDDVVVVSLMQDAWLVHWFDSKGSLRGSLKIPRDALPRLSGDSGVLSSLERVVPDSSGRAVIIQVDYSREIDDPQTKSRSGIEYAGSWLYRMDLLKGTVTDRWEIPPLEQAPQGTGGGEGRFRLVPEFLGMAGERFFFLVIDDSSQASVAMLDRNTKALETYRIDINPDELYFSTMRLSPEGVLSALLGTKYEARIVWWRFDKLGSGREGLAK